MTRPVRLAPVSASLAASLGAMASLGLASVAPGQEAAPPPPPDAPDAQIAATPDVPGAPPYDRNDPWLWGDQAVLRGLDKVTAQTRDFTAPVGEDVAFLGLMVSVKRCAKRPPERTPEVIVGMEIANRRGGAESGEAGGAQPVRVADAGGSDGAGARLFSGWMFASSPALNPLEHPVYDVWVLDCINSRAPVEEPAPAAGAEDEPSAPVAGPLPGEVFD